MVTQRHIRLAASELCRLNERAMLQAQGLESEAPFCDESEVGIAMIGEKSPVMTSVAGRLSSAMVS